MVLLWHLCSPLLIAHGNMSQCVCGHEVGLLCHDWDSSEGGPSLNCGHGNGRHVIAAHCCDGDGIGRGLLHFLATIMTTDLRAPQLRPRQWTVVPQPQQQQQRVTTSESGANNRLSHGAVASEFLTFPFKLKIFWLYNTELLLLKIVIFII